MVQRTRAGRRRHWSGDNGELSDHVIFLLVLQCMGWCSSHKQAVGALEWGMMVYLQLQLRNALGHLSQACEHLLTIANHRLALGAPSNLRK